MKSEKIVAKLLKTQSPVKLLGSTLNLREYKLKPFVQEELENMQKEEKLQSKQTQKQSNHGKEKLKKNNARLPEQRKPWVQDDDSSLSSFDYQERKMSKLSFQNEKKTQDTENQHKESAPSMKSVFNPSSYLQWRSNHWASHELSSHASKYQ